MKKNCSAKMLSLREVQLSSLDILKEIDKLCLKLDLDYFVMYGTLIGVVRHNGFIPWDDDIDIMMPRNDYNKLISYLKCNKKNILPLELFNYDDNVDYPYMISRVSDSRYILDVDNEKDYGIGTFIDIYPLDNLSDNYIIAKLKGRYFGSLSSLYFLATRLSLPKSESRKTNFLKHIAFKLAKLIGKGRLKKMLSVNRLSSELSLDGYVGCKQWMTSDYERNIFKSSLMRGRKRVIFENIEVNIPIHFDQILSDYYGDYMALPPKEDRIPHHFYDAYKK